MDTSLMEDALRWQEQSQKLLQGDHTAGYNFCKDCFLYSFNPLHNPPKRSFAFGYGRKGLISYGVFGDVHAQNVEMSPISGSIMVTAPSFEWSFLVYSLYKCLLRIHYGDTSLTEDLQGGRNKARNCFSDIALLNTFSAWINLYIFITLCTLHPNILFSVGQGGTGLMPHRVFSNALVQDDKMSPIFESTMVTHDSANPMHYKIQSESTNANICITPFTASPSLSSQKDEVEIGQHCMP